MRVRGPFLVASFVVLTACSGTGGNRNETEASAVPVETTAATTTTIAPTTTKPKGLGVTQVYRTEEIGYEGGTYEGKVTVFRYRDARALEPDVEAELNAQGERTVAIEARVCVTKVPPGKEVYISWQPWSLGNDQGESYEVLSSWSGEITTKPIYPEDKVTPVGTCRRGWIPFQIPRKWQPDFVEYNTGEGKILKWPIRK